MTFTDSAGSQEETAVTVFIFRDFHLLIVSDDMIAVHGVRDSRGRGFFRQVQTESRRTPVDDVQGANLATTPPQQRPVPSSGRFLLDAHRRRMAAFGVVGLFPGQPLLVAAFFALLLVVALRAQQVEEHVEEEQDRPAVHVREETLRGS